METEFVYNLTLTYFTKNKVANLDRKYCLQLKKEETGKQRRKIEVKWLQGEFTWEVSGGNLIKDGACSLRGTWSRAKQQNPLSELHSSI